VSPTVESTIVDAGNRDILRTLSTRTDIEAATKTLSRLEMEELPCNAIAEGP
jgi:hypothetical protein